MMVEGEEVAFRGVGPHGRDPSRKDAQRQPNAENPLPDRQSEHAGILGNAGKNVNWIEWPQESEKEFRAEIRGRYPKSRLTMPGLVDLESGKGI
jgi:hypothetical protein